MNNNLTLVKTKNFEYYVDDNGQKQGKYKWYHYDSSQLHVICNFVDDLKQGEYKSYHDNGQLDVICNFVDDLRHGEFKSYYPNGELKELKFYNHGSAIS